MTVERKQIIGVTMGDASGVGPEIIVKALRSENIYSICCPVVIGEGTVMSGTIRLLKSPLKLRSVGAPDDAQGESGTIDLIDMQNLDIREVIPGQVCVACGKAAMEFIAEAARLATQGQIKAIATAPINKEATRQAGCGDVAHLEFLARFTHATEYAGMLVSGPLRVVHLTTHYSLKDACALVTKERILAILKLIHDSFRQWGFLNPCIAVAALNPHGGDGGLFGSEEIEQIIPAVKEARESGMDTMGPFPADSVFHRAARGEFDVVLAMYHDQGHIAIKVFGFEESVSVSLGLPFVRTSVDHGTAFDIAGRGIADSRSLEEAIKLAVRLSKGEGLM